MDRQAGVKAYSAQQLRMYVDRWWGKGGGNTQGPSNASWINTSLGSATPLCRAQKCVVPLDFPISGFQFDFNGAPAAGFSSSSFNHFKVCLQNIVAAGWPGTIFDDGSNQALTATVRPGSGGVISGQSMEVALPATVVIRKGTYWLSIMTEQIETANAPSNRTQSVSESIGSQTSVLRELSYNTALTAISDAFPTASTSWTDAGGAGAFASAIITLLGVRA